MTEKGQPVIERKRVIQRVHPTIGFTIQWGPDNNYIQPVWQGAIEATQSYNLNLMSFAGRRDTMLRDANYNPAAMHQINTDNLDGMVIVTSGLEDIRQLEGYGALPIVTIGETNGEFPGVVSDNHGGMRAALAHLIEEHGYRRIAFIQGLSVEGIVAPDAIPRYRAYIDTLEKYGLSQDPQLILPGYFDIKSGEDAARILLERQGKFDAVVAANDKMAIGAMHVLEEHGLRVPYDVAVVGFDDSQEASFSTPPLTTVRQPLKAMGHRAIELVLAQLRGETVPAEEILPTELIVRQSCGCFSENVLQAASKRRGDSIGNQSVSTDRYQIVSEMKKALVGSEAGLETDWAEQLVDALLTDLGDQNASAFLATLDKIARQIIAQQAPVTALHGPLSALRRHAQSSWLSNRRAEDLWQQARVFLSETELRQQAQARALAENQDNILRQIGTAMITTFDEAALMDLLAHELPQLEIRSCFVALYEGEGNPPECSRLVLAQIESRRLTLEAEGRRTITRDLIPAELLPDQRYNLLSMPLYFREESLGFVVFEAGLRNGIIYEVLRARLSSALKGALLVKQMEQRAEELASSNKQLAQAYQSLQEHQEKLLLAEKMASLGRLTAGIAHEMNTPLAAVRASLVEATKLTEEYQDSIGAAEVTADDHRQIAQELRKSLQLADKAAERVTGFVRGIKAQTRNPAQPVWERFDVVTVILDTLLLLNHALKKGNCTMTFDPPDDYVGLVGAPDRLSQVVTNLVTNAIDASQSKGGGPITLRLECTSQGVSLHVGDSGCGIPPEILSKIYDPMFTTKPFGQGTGLGLTIVHDIVTGEFGGTIEVSSQVGVSTTFSIQFPVPPEALISAKTG